MRYTASLTIDRLHASQAARGAESIMRALEDMKRGTPLLGFAFEPSRDDGPCVVGWIEVESSSTCVAAVLAAGVLDPLLVAADLPREYAWLRVEPSED